MARLRIGQAAEILGVSPDTVRRWVDAGRLHGLRTPGGQREIDGTELAGLLHEQASATRGAHAHGQGASARNRLAGIVTDVTKDRVMAQVELVCGSNRIVSLMTREAADELGLEPGMLAVATIKATNVVVELAPAHPAPVGTAPPAN